MAVTLIAWTETTDGRRYWIQKRSKQVQLHAGMLDTIASGSLKAGERPLDGIVREANEEAGIEAEFGYKHIKAAGCTMFHAAHNTDKTPGSQPQIRYDYELQLPGDMRPVVSDHEAELFFIMSQDEVWEQLLNGGFKSSLGLTWIAHFVRQGVITPESEPHYLEICSGITRQARHV